MSVSQIDTVSESDTELDVNPFCALLYIRRFSAFFVWCRESEFASDLLHFYKFSNTPFFVLR